MKGTYVKYLTSLAALLSLLLFISPADAFAAELKNGYSGIYTVKIDNKLFVGTRQGEYRYEPVYVTGVALDEHTLVLPLTYIDDAMGGKFLFYFMDRNMKLMVLITGEVLKPVGLSTYEQRGVETGYHIIARRDGVTIAGPNNPGRLDEGNVSFVFNAKSELNAIATRSLIDSRAIKVFYEDYLRVVKEDGGVHEVLKKLANGR